MDGNPRNRRRVLRLAGSGFVGLLAGCTSSDDDGSPDGTVSTTSVASISSTTTETTTTEELGYTREKMEEFRQETLQESLETSNLNSVVQRLVEDEGEFFEHDAYPGDHTTFHQDKLQETENPKDAINWVAPPLKHKLHQKYGSAFSVANNHYSAGTEKAVNQINQQGIQLHGGYFTNPEYGNGDSHGLSFFFEHKTGNWFQKDTTGREIIQLNDQEEREQSIYYPGAGRAGEEDGVYNPLLRFEPGPADVIGYKDKSQYTRNAILSLAKFTGHEQIANTWVQDKALDLFIEAIHDGVHIDELIDTPMETVYRSVVEEEDHIGFYADGNTYQDLEVVQGNSDIYQETMENSNHVTTHQINQMLSG